MFEYAIDRLAERKGHQIDYLAANAAAQQAGFPQERLAFVNISVIKSLLLAYASPYEQRDWMIQLAYLAFVPEIKRLFVKMDTSLN